MSSTNTRSNNYDKMMMVSVREGNTGDLVDLEFEGPRFFHKHYGKVSADFMRMNDWSILGALADIILFFRPYCIVELGAGKSTFILARAGYSAGVEMHTVDKKPEKKAEFYEKHTYYQMFTDDFMTAFDDTPAIVLIDADHSYKQAKKEFEFFYERLIPGGVIFIHDTFPPHEWYLKPTGCHDVYKLRQEIEQRREEFDCDVFTWPYTALFMGLTMIIKKDPERAYFGR